MSVGVTLAFSLGCHGLLHMCVFAQLAVVEEVRQGHVHWLLWNGRPALLSGCAWDAVYIPTHTCSSSFVRRSSLTRLVFLLVQIIQHARIVLASAGLSTTLQTPSSSSSNAALPGLLLRVGLCQARADPLGSCSCSCFCCDLGSVGLEAYLLVCAHVAMMMFIMMMAEARLFLLTGQTVLLIKSHGLWQGMHTHTDLCHSSWPRCVCVCGPCLMNSPPNGLTEETALLSGMYMHLHMGRLFATVGVVVAHPLCALWIDL